MSWRRLEDVFEDKKNVTLDVFSTSSPRHMFAESFVSLVVKRKFGRTSKSLKMLGPWLYVLEWKVTGKQTYIGKRHNSLIKL